MSEAVAYVRETAPLDVVETLDWLLAQRFVVRQERGGRGESFGNVLLELGRKPYVVRIAKDRGQWTLEIAPRGSDFEAMHVLLTAQNDDEQQPEDLEPNDPISEQWPPGVSWSAAVPALVRWLDAANRRREIKKAHGQWVELMRRRFGGDVR